MKTKRTNRVAKVAFILLIVVTLFFSIGAGYQVPEGRTIICKTIEKYDALKVIADAVQIEEVEEETVETEIEEEIEEVETEEVIEETVIVETVSATVETVETEEVVEETTVEEEIEETVEEIVEEVEEYEAPAMQEWSIGLPEGTMNYFTEIGYDTLCNNLQQMIDDGHIVRYNNYFAGHNPGAMGHLAEIEVGSVVRVSYGNGEYRDYTIVAHTTGSGSFGDVTIGGYNLWDLVQSGGFVVQFCRGGSNNFFYGI